MGLELENNDNISIESIDSIKSNDSVVSGANKFLVINENSVSKILSCPTKKNIVEILKCLQTQNLATSYDFVQKIINKNGISLLELTNNIFEFAMDYLINNNTEFIKYPQTTVIEIIKKMAVINENLTYCNNENIQLISFIAVFYM